MNWENTELKILTSEYQKGTSYRRIVQVLREKGYERTPNQLIKQAYNLGLQRKYEALVEGKRLGHFDIEASQLNASFGFMISWAIKEDGGKVISDYITKKDFLDAGYDDPDRRIVKTMVDTLNEFDIITYHFGTYFDAPFARTRAIHYGFKFPEYGALYQIDTWKWAKRNLKLHSNRLESIAEFLGVNNKTHLKPAMWRRATRGDEAAIKYIVDHNKKDVITLEKVYHKLKEYSPGTRSSI